MAHLIHGEVKVSFHKNGNWQDLADILLVNGYTLQIKLEKDKLPFEDKDSATVTIMTEVE